MIINSDGVLLCPICHFDYVHMAYVVVNQGGDVTTVDKNGTHFEESVPSGRGSRITIGCWCESNHTFQVSFQFHKGITYLEQDLLTKSPNEMGYLWRD